MDLSVILVNYYSREDLRECLGSLPAAALGLRFETLVVNNSPGERIADILESRYEGVVLVENQTNEGYAKGLNRGIERCRGRNILFLNSDLILLPESVAQMASFLDLNFKTQGVAAVGPKLLNLDGSLQYSKGSFPSLMATVKDQFLPRKMRKYSLRGCDEPGLADWVSGCCLMVTREALDKVGPLDENFFMHYEEVDFCFRLKSAHLKVFYYPKAMVVHKKPHAHRPRGSNGKLEVEIRRSHLYFYRKNYGCASYRLLFLCTFAFVGCRCLLGRLRSLLSSGERPGGWRIDLQILKTLRHMRF